MGICEATSLEIARDRGCLRRPRHPIDLDELIARSLLLLLLPQLLLLLLLLPTPRRRQGHCRAIGGAGGGGAPCARARSPQLACQKEGGVITSGVKERGSGAARLQRLSPVGSSRHSAASLSSASGESPLRCLSPPRAAISTCIGSNASVAARSRRPAVASPRSDAATRAPAGSLHAHTPCNRDGELG